MKYKFLFYLILKFCIGGISQPPTQLDFFHLNINNGLTQASNYFIYKDSIGYIWLSSTAGLNRYNGKNIVTYFDIPDDSSSIYGQNVNGHFSEDDKNNLWFSTYHGINCYDRKKDIFIHAVRKNSLGLPVLGYFSCGMDNENRLWLIHQDSLFYYHTLSKEFQPVISIMPNVNRGRIRFDNNGKIRHFFAFEKGQSFLNFTSFIEDTISTSKNLEFNGQNSNGLPLLKIQDIYSENDTLIWISSRQGLIEFNLNTFRYKKHHKYDEIELGTITCAQPYKNQYLVVSSIGNGLLFFDKIEGKFVAQFLHSKNNSSSIIGNSLGAVYTTSDNEIFATINGRGVSFSCPSKKKFSSYLSNREKENNRRYSLKSLIDLGNGKFMAATYSREILMLNEEKEVIDLLNNRNPIWISSSNLIHIFKDKFKRVWVLNYNGIGVYNFEDDKLSQLTDANESFWYGCGLKNGKVLLSPKKGGIVSVKHKSNNKISFEKVVKNSSSSVYTFLYEGSNNLLYACSQLKALDVFDIRANFQFQKTIPIIGDIKCMYDVPRDSILWIGTDRGLVKLNKINNSFRYFTKNDGLSNSTIYGIQPDKLGNLWLSTNHGITKFNPTNSNCKIFRKNDGLSSLEYNTFSSLKRANGEIWFGSTNGLTTFYPDSIKSNLSLPQIQITNIKINDEESAELICTETGATNVSEIFDLELKPKQNTLSFEFVALEYSDPSNNQYQYKMEGIDDEWVSSGANGFARYPNLPPNEYTFQIKGSNSDGDFGEPRELKILIHPPFYLRSWFILLSLLTGIGIIWFSAYAYRKRKEKIQQLVFEKKLALEQERLRIAKDMHDDLGSGLSTLSLRTKMIFQQASNADIKKELKKVANLADKLTQKVREVIWVVTSQNDPLEKLIVFLHKYASDLFENTNINCQITLPENIPNKTIFGENRRMLLLTFKEALNNIIKHAEATEALINIDVKDEELLISIQDNGIGFDPILIEQSSGNGLINMRQRISEIQGSFSVRTSSKGTLILLSLPI